MSITGNENVDKLINVAFVGNITDENWYKVIKFENGRTDLIGITILSEIVYWYRPKETRGDEMNPQTTFVKKFKTDLLQLRYSYIMDKFGFSRKQIGEAFTRLEGLGLIKRHLRTVPVGDKVLGNVLYIELFADKLIEITTVGRVSNAKQQEQPKKEVPKVQPKKTENKDKPKQTKETENIPYEEIVAYLNEKAKPARGFMTKTKLTRKNIKARWDEGFTLEDFKTVIDKKVYGWKGTKMEEHLTPKTLFGENFETYLIQEKKKWVDFSEQKKSQQTTPTQTYNKFELPY